MKRTLLIIILLCVVSVVRAATIPDDFNRADTTLSSDTSLIGANWAQAAGSANRWRIGGNTIHAQTAAAPGILFNTAWPTENGDGDSFTVSLDVAGQSVSVWSGVAFNYNNPSNYYTVRFKTGYDDYQILGKRSDGSWQTIASGDATSVFTVGTFYTIEVSSDTAYTYGFTITETGSGTLVAQNPSVVDNESLCTGGYAGLSLDSASPSVEFAQFDNFSLSAASDTKETAFDNFNRTDTTESADPSLIGSHWQQDSSVNAWQIDGNTLYSHSQEVPPEALFNNEVQTLNENGYSFNLGMDVAGQASASWQGVVFNYNNPSNFYTLRFKAGYTDYQLLGKRSDGSWKVIRSGQASATFAIGTFYHLSVSSDAAHTYRFSIAETGSGTVMAPETELTDDESLSSGGYAGTYFSAAGRRVRYDNFLLETYSETPPDPAAGFAFNLVAETPTQPPYQILESLGIEPVWAATPVGFALLTESNRQFVAYYDANRQMTIAQRTLGSPAWTFKKLDSYLLWDSHNYITIALDADGYLHVSGNMHVVPLIYFRSTNPYDVTSLQQIAGMVGDREQEVTYPKFLENANGEMIFTYRDGSSGDGDQLYNIYDEATQTWSRLIDSPLADGEGTRNAYFVGPTLGPDGWFHITWVWRENPGCESNHDLSYAKSQDLVNWFRADGIAVPLPFKLGTPGLIVDPVPVYGGMLNGNGKIGFDFQNRVILTYHKFDENGNTQIYNARWENGAWAIHRTTNWDYRWYFSGGGSIITEVNIGTVEQIDGELRLPWSHIIEGSGEFILDETTLWGARYIARRRWPSEIGSVRSTFPEMRVKLRWDTNRDSGYILRWEALPNNRDLPRDPPYPDPSLLEVYKIVK
ncbi:MAG: BNR repeat-containing protein [Verrucomicrobiota bacterium]|nr:BNR repeat-containing protein [Verrucomicrobiota bacterium]